MAPTETDDDLHLLEETVEVEQPRGVVAGSIASFLVLTAVAVGIGLVVTLVALFWGPVLVLPFVPAGSD